MLSVDNTDWQTNVSITMGKKEKNSKWICWMWTTETGKSTSSWKGKIANEKKLQTHQECRKTISNSLTIAKAVHKFHAAVSRGQLSICSCCNQFACGINTVLLMPKGREFPILIQENIE